MMDEDKDLQDVLALLALVNDIRENRPDIVITRERDNKLSAYVTVLNKPRGNDVQG